MEQLSSWALIACTALAVYLLVDLYKRWANRP